MRWRVARLYGSRDGADDALGNPAREAVDLGEAAVRPAPYGSTRQDNDGNAYGDAPMTFVTPMPMSRAEKVEEAVLGGTRYKVTGRADLGRMRLLTLQRVKGA